MSRLTRKASKQELIDSKYLFNYVDNSINPNPLCNPRKVSNVYDKLGKLEDLEEKYGLPLDVLVTLLDRYQYYDEDGHLKIIHSLDMYHKQILIKKYENDDDIYGYYEHLNFKDYKVTWWLKEDKSE